MFRIVTYNIFARSLGSNCIPWVLSVNDSWHEKITAIVECSFDKWIESSLTPEYKKHFHKNYISGNKVEMRKLWSQDLKTAADISSKLTGISFLSEDCVRYNVTNASTGEIKQEIAITLKGLLRRDMPDIADDLYSHIMETDSYFQWDNRGTKIYHEAIRINDADEPTADIVSLLEYDIHTGEAAYRGPGLVETFPEAMMSSGYWGCLMNGPLESDISGIGMFWKDSVFELANAPQESQGSGAQAGAVFTLQTGESYQGCAFNYDMMEHWHRITPPDREAPGEVLSSRYELMAQRDRRNVGIVLLRHREAGRVVMVVSVHLMTESRDCSDTNEFPGDDHITQNLHDA
jgi:hypothetical protein